MKRGFLLCAAAVLLGSATAHAGEWPERPIKLIVPFPAGGPTDWIGREAADILGKALKQSVIVDNRPGANGALGLDVLAHAAPDGYTIGLAGISLATLPHLGMGHWDPIKDFTPISNVASTTPIFVANNEAPFNNLKELAAYAKEHPGKVSYGTPGVSTIPHLAAELFQTLAGVKLNHIPYKGASQQITDLIGGQTQLDSQSSLVVAMPFVKDKRVKALAVLSDSRSPLLPDVPTVKEAGYPGVVAAPWFGIGGPAGLSPEVVQKLHAALLKGLSEKAEQDKFSSMGMVVQTSASPQAFGQYIHAEYDRWGKVIKDADIKAQ